MTRRTSRLATSANAAFADVPTTLDTPDDTMSLDVPEQLLTPENSRSETSSNNENALTDDNSSSRRRSTRAVRASFRAVEAQQNTPVKKDESVDESSQAYVDNLANSKRSRSSLRHSIAVMESSLRSSNALPADDTVMEGSPVVPDTPVSNSSQEPPSEDMKEPLQRRALRTRVDKLLDEGEADSPKATPRGKSAQSSPRRSSRLSIVSKTSDLLGRVNSVLGKRGRDSTTKGKEIGRRASLRPRNVATVKEEKAAPAPEPSSKKRRVSESDLNTLKKTETPSEEPAPPPVPRYKPKVWLTHGLYSGQEPSNSPPKQRRNKDSKPGMSVPAQRESFPMPMFAGARIIDNGRDFRLPFDIFSPLPPGQPKPDEWRKTNKNVFVGDAADEWKATKKLELSTCMCLEETGCDEDCQNRYMFYECDSGNCRLGPECGNRNFSELKARTKAGGKYNIGVEVIKTSDRGYGVRSNRSFEPNQIIVEYTGEIITQFECERRMRTVYKKNECYYLMYFDQNMIIDATRGSIARFVNHSCEPNCRMEKWTVAGKPRMALFAGDRGIMTGEELSYDYNFDPYSNKNVQECRCGAENCRGILGPRPKDKDQRTNTEAATTTKKAAKAGTKRKRGTATTTPSPAKKRKILSAKSIKAGVKKAVTKASSTSRKPAAASKARGQSKGNADPKKAIKLPKVKASSKVKAAVRGPRRAADTMKASPSSPAAKTSQLKRPSAETKKRILANAAKGSKPAAKKSPAKAKKATAEAKPARKPVARKAPIKSPMKAKMPAQMKKTTSATEMPKSLAGSVRAAAKNVVRSVKGGK